MSAIAGSDHLLLGKHAPVILDEATLFWRAWCYQLLAMSSTSGEQSILCSCLHRELETALKLVVEKCAEECHSEKARLRQKNLRSLLYEFPFLSGERL